MISAVLMTLASALLLSVLRSSGPVRVHAEIFKHRFHSPLHTGVRPEDHRLRSTGEQLQLCALLHTIIFSCQMFSDDIMLCWEIKKNP